MPLAKNIHHLPQAALVHGQPGAAATARPGPGAALRHLPLSRPAGICCGGGAAGAGRGPLSRGPTAARGGKGRLGQRGGLRAAAAAGVMRRGVRCLGGNGLENGILCRSSVLRSIRPILKWL